MKRFATCVLAAHLTLSAVFWSLAVFGPTPPAFYALVFLYVVNFPGVWTLKALVPRDWLTSVPSPYGELVMVLVTQIVAVAILFLLWLALRRRADPQSR